MEDDVLDRLRARGELAFPELAADVDGDTGALFLACRRLERRGQIRAVLPLVYRPASGSSAAERADSGDQPGGDAVATDGSNELTRGGTRSAGYREEREDDEEGDDGHGDGEQDDGGFVWVGDG